MGIISRLIGVAVDFGDSDLANRLSYLEKHTVQWEDQMSQEVDQLVTRFNDATNEIANDLRELRDQLNSGVSVAELNEKFAPLVERLESLGADGDDPVSNTDPETTTDPVNSPAADEQVVVDELGDDVADTNGDNVS